MTYARGARPIDSRGPTSATLDPAAGSAPRHPVVLYYHHVHPTLRHYTSLTPDAFARSLDVLLEVMAPCDPRAARGGGAPALPGEPSFLLTFDDGYLDTWEHALPALEARGLRALFFVTTRLVGVRDGGDPTRSFLDWPQCRELVARGHEVGSHGVHHRPLTDLSADEAREDVRVSLAEVSAATGAPCPFYSYPFGFVPPVPVCPPHVVAFGTVKAPARRWASHPHDIRRTYLPTGGEDRWRALAAGWRRQWDEDAHAPAHPAPAGDGPLSALSAATDGPPESAGSTGGLRPPFPALTGEIPCETQ